MTQRGRGEGVRKQRGEVPLRLAAMFGVTHDREIGRKLDERLPTHTTWRRRLISLGCDDEEVETPHAARHRRGEGRALCTDTRGVRRVLDIAAGEDAAISAHQDS